MHRLLLFALILAGCSVPEVGEHCGEIQRRSDGVWLLPTVSASQGSPAFAVYASSALQTSWAGEFQLPACGTTVEWGQSAPWAGPVLRPGERDTLDVVLVDNSASMNVITRDGPWNASVVVDGGAVRAEPSSWVGPVSEAVRAGFLVVGVSEGKSLVRVVVRTPYSDTPLVRSFEYVVNATAGEPHRAKA